MSARSYDATLPAGTSATILAPGVITGAGDRIGVLLATPHGPHALHHARLFVILDVDEDWPDRLGMSLLVPTLARGEPAVIVAETRAQVRRVVARVTRGGSA